MVTRAPVSASFTELGSPAPRSPLSVVVIAPVGASGTATPNQVLEVGESNKAVLGTDGMLLDAYNRFTAHATPFFYVLPYEASNDAATLATNIKNAIAALGSDDERVKFTETYNRPRLAVLPGVGTGATDADDNITALKALAGSDSMRIGGVFVDGRSDSLADARTWLGNNAGDSLVAVMNNGGSTSGAIIAASQWIRYTDAHRLDINPIGADFPLDTPAPSPVWSFLPDSTTAAANVLRANSGTVIITYNGDHLLWGGKIDTAVANSPFESVGARLVVFEMADRMEARLFRLNGNRLTDAELERASTDLSAIAEEYVLLGECADARVGNPVLGEDNFLRAPLHVEFDRIQEAAQLNVTVAYTEVA